MKVAVVGSRSATEKDYKVIEDSMPQNTSEIVSGGAVGVDTLAKRYANENKLIMTEFLPDYNDPKLDNKKAAPLIRNRKIVEYSDFVLAFWDGRSKGTAFTIEYARKLNKPFKIIILND